MNAQKAIILSIVVLTAATLFTGGYWIRKRTKAPGQEPPSEVAQVTARDTVTKNDVALEQRKETLNTLKETKARVDSKIRSSGEAALKKIRANLPPAEQARTNRLIDKLGSENEKDRLAAYRELQREFKKTGTRNAIAAWGEHMRTIQSTSQMAWNDLSDEQKNLLRRSAPSVPSQQALKDHYKKMHQTRTGGSEK